MELLIPTLLHYLFCWNYVQSSQNSHCTWCSPPKYEGILSRKSFLWENKLFWAKKLWGLVLNTRTNDQIMRRSGRSFINDKCFFYNLNTVNLHLKIKFWPFHKVMKVFILKVLTVKRSQKLFHVQFPLCWLYLVYWYIIWKVNTRNRGMNLKNNLCTMPQGVGMSCKVCGLGKVNGLGVEETKYVVLS